MAPFPPRRRLAFAAICAVVVACLLSAQGLSYAAFLDNSGRDRSGPTALAEAEMCSHADDGGGHAPSHGHHHNGHCWAQCCHGGRLESYFAFITRWSAAAVLIVPQADNASENTFVIADDPPRPRSGWASSWSSRAPPAFL
jgi:hypothetical protein